MISALAVVVSHTTIYLKEFGLDPNIFGSHKGQPEGLLLAGFGVSIFFVISGFLITYLLQEEKNRQDINIRKFYFRRILRIWPLYYLYLSIAVIFILVFGLGLNIKWLLLYIFYAANVPFILGAGMPFLTHYWSLGVEEQFYLFWPWINKKLKRLEGFLIAAILVLVGAKLLLHFFKPGSVAEEAIHVTRFHCMMIGALGAVLYRKKNQTFIKIASNKVTQLICWLVIVSLAINRFHIASVIDNELVSVVALLLIIGQIEVKNRIFNLENNVCDFLGKISYGIYVIHPLLIFLFAKLLGTLQPTILSYLFVYTSIMLLTISLSFLSYRYFESYFLKVKKKFEVVKSSASRQEYGIGDKP